MGIQKYNRILKRAPIILNIDLDDFRVNANASRFLFAPIAHLMFRASRWAAHKSLHTIACNHCFKMAAVTSYKTLRAARA